MGQLDLRHLLAIGDAAVRAINFISSGMTGEHHAELNRALRDVGGDDAVETILVGEPGDSFIRLGGSVSQSAGGWSSSLDLALSSECDSPYREVYWYFKLGGRPQPTIQVCIEAWIVDVLLLVWLRPQRGNSDSEERPAPDVLAILKQSHTRSERAKIRAAFQGLDALTRGVVIAIDPNWSDGTLRSTVQAQLIEWCLRVHGDPHRARIPDLDDDVINWWRDWAARLARRNSDDDKPDAAEMYEVARRTLRPSHPAAHRKYWHKWLAPRSERLVRDAAGQTGVSVRTIYSRMRKAGLHTRDFAEREHPLSELVVFLRGGSSVRSIPDQRRTIRDALIESGMNSEAARKFERRIRELPSEEQARRVAAALARNKRTAGPANARYST